MGVKEIEAKDKGRTRRHRLILLVLLVVVPLGFVASCGPGVPIQTENPNSAPTSSVAPDIDSESARGIDPECPVITPRELPSGQAPGAPQSVGVPEDQESSIDPVPLTTWGEGNDRITQAGGAVALSAVGGAAFERSSWADEQIVLAEGSERLVLPVGDPGEIQILFEVGDCRYVNWIGPGYTLSEALEYAGRM